MTSDEHYFDSSALTLLALEAGTKLKKLSLLGPIQEVTYGPGLFQYLPAMSNLTELDLFIDSSYVHRFQCGELARYLSNLPKLEVFVLDLEDNEHIEHCHNLMFDVYSALAGCCKQLRSLELQRIVGYGNGITDIYDDDDYDDDDSTLQHFDKLQQLKHLKHLDLCDARCLPRNFEKVVPNITYLNLNLLLGVRMVLLRSAQKLVHLELDCCALEDIDLEDLCNCAELQLLSVCCNENLHGEGFRKLSSVLTKLTSVDVSDCQITPKGMISILALPTLRFLNISGIISNDCDFTNFTISELFETFQQIPSHMTVIHRKRTYLVNNNTSDALEMALSHCKRLTEREFLDFRRDFINTQIVMSL